MSPKFIVLIILDGWGIAPPIRGNAISLAATPFFNKLVTTYPTMALQSAGELVGLPWGEMGNSEVGHISLGAGRIIYQNLPRITKAISDGSYFKNKAFEAAFQHVKKYNSALHLMGLVSDGGVHSSAEHLYALLESCKDQKIGRVYIHAFLDGRDAPRNSAENFIDQLQQRIAELKIGKIATLSGRYYAMDRDNRWDRIEKAYLAIAEGKSEQTATDPLQTIQKSYEQLVFDEEFLPTVILENGKPVAKMADNDAIIFFNFWPDRARQITKAFILPQFDKFKKQRQITNIFFVSMTEYEKELPVSAVAFPPEKITKPLAKVISDQGLKQLHIAETEKYAHVTFFFNGGRETTLPGEDWILIPSPSVASYDQKPEMSAREIRDKVVEQILGGKYQLIVINFANADMVGHTGNLNAAVKAIEVIDECLQEIIQTVFKQGGAAIITADHGNAEEMMKVRTGEIDKEHSSNAVPFILVGEAWQGQSMVPTRDLSTIRSVGILADIAPTILKIMNIPQPKEMNGRSLI